MPPETIDTSIPSLQRLAKRGRWLVVSTVASSKAGHVGGPLSAMDLLVTLFFAELRIRPDDPTWPDRDRFVLSKGHAAIGLYVVMALRGFLPVDELATFDKGDSRLQGHPDMTKLPGVDMSTGSLGQGLSVGVGMALGARLAERAPHTWVLLGDGELQEGMVWEAIHTAGRYGLGNLTAIVDCNGLQQFGWPAGVDDRGDRRDPWAGVDLARAFDAFGWRVIELDGHDFEQVASAYKTARSAADGDRPTVLLARTTKGKGLSFAEGRHTWHTGLATDEELARARVELDVEDLSGGDQ
ncbi:MAG: transketolase [Nocardioidaceae bacterium]